MNAPENKVAEQLASAPVVAAPTPKPAPAPEQALGPNVAVGFNTSASFDLLQRASKLLAASSLVPKDYQGNLPNCVIALNMASRLGADPLLVMQNLYLVHGKPGWSSQFLIATFNQSGRFSAMRFEFFGDKGTDGYGCRAWAIEKETGDKLYGADVTIAIARAEGWYQRTGSKWQTMPQQMLMYRAASWFVRTTAPELSMGLQTAEELGDVYDARRGTDGTFSVDPQTGEILPPRAAQAEELPANATATDKAKAKLRASAKTATPADAPAATPAPADAATAVPAPDKEKDDAIVLRAAKTPDDLKAIWKSIRTYYLAADLDVPLPTEALYHQRKEALAQAADL